MRKYSLKILFFTMAMHRGGAERVISTLCNGDMASKHQLYLLTVLKGRSEYKLNKKVWYHGLISSKKYFEKGKWKTFPVVCLRYFKYVQRIKPDMIVCFLPEPCFVAGLFRNILQIPVIGSERGNPYYQFKSPVYKILGNWLYGRADGFVFQTEGARSYFSPRIYRKSVIIGNPISKEPIPDVKLSGRKKEIVAVGRFAPEKNYPLLIRAFAEIIKIHPEFKLIIYGKYEEGNKDVKMIKELGLTEHIILAGQVEKVKQHIYNAYAYVLTSLSEGLPNALMEAMSAGLPVVATDCPSGGPKQLIRNGKNGLLVENNNEKAVVQALLTLVEHPALAQRLGDEARKIQDEYSEEKVSRIWIQYIEKVNKVVNGG